jgi:indolepyruvate ferredoxin oxidoreductase beta subunit
MDNEHYVSRFTFDVYLVGVGGQGILTIGEIIMSAAFTQGIPVNFYPTKGMAQRGGFVKAQLRMGREKVGPSIPEKGADLVIATEVSELLKAVRFIKPGGDGVGYNVVLFGFVWAPTAVMLGKAPYPTLEQVLEQVRAAGGNLHYIAPERLPVYEGAPVPDNIYVLGAALAQTRLGQILDVSDVAGIVRNRWKRGLERNLFALEAGVRSQTRRDLAWH